MARPRPPAPVVMTPAPVPPPAERRGRGPSADATPRLVSDPAALWGERLRRVALGATAMLVTARAYWAGEPDYRVDAGGGLGWVLALLVVAGVAVAGTLVGGTFRYRWSWLADPGVYLLALLAATSAGHAVDHRVGINLGWDWAAVGVAWFLFRTLPRTRGESVGLAAGVAAAAVAVAAYGMFQVVIELPGVQADYRANPELALRLVGITPGTPSQALFESRLLGSNEPYSTFGLANSLAGFLAGPLVVGLALIWDAATGRGRTRGGSNFGEILLAAVPTSLLLLCLIATKSRSAYVGVAVGVAVLAWRERTRVSRRTWITAATSVTVVLAGLIAAGLASGRLDREVLTQSGTSFRYRLEYWAGTWRMLNANSRTFWQGVGPGNFAAAYLRHKAPEASEEIHDPHNLVLEVWSTAGICAVGALALSVAGILWGTLAPERPETVGPDEWPETTPPPKRGTWLVVAAGAGWLAVVLLGKLNPFEGDLFYRWLVLAAGWGVAVACASTLWRHIPLRGEVLGAAALAVMINLLAAGGISVPAVALGMWGLAAAGLNLRNDRDAGRLRTAGWGRVPAFGLAAVLAAVFGTFTGSVPPFWRMEAAMDRAEEKMRAKPPDYEGAEVAYREAEEADHYSARPWSAAAGLEYLAWNTRGGKPSDLRWKKVIADQRMAIYPPRSPESWTRHRERAMTASLLVKDLGGKVTPRELTVIRGHVVEASRTAVRLYPTNPSLRAWLAEASADIGMTGDAAVEAREALRLDDLTPHADKKLDPNVRVWLRAHLPDWELVQPLIPSATPHATGAAPSK